MGNQAPCCGAEDVASLKQQYGKFLPTPHSPSKINMVNFTDNELRVSDSGATSLLAQERGGQRWSRPMSTLSSFNGSAKLGFKMQEDSLVNISNTDV